MSVKGRPYTWFKAALDRGDLAAIRAEAAELPSVRLDDALRICLVMRDQSEDATYERAVVRWIGRFALEVRSAGLEDLREAAGAFEDLRVRPDTAMERLASLCSRHRLAFP
ncbi:MAG: hypothetical protein JWQ48_4236 [Conexibacter sp.]|jgi:hypothetical protein|nr:hypothetical protein [Conexibacter sp.]